MPRGERFGDGHWAGGIANGNLQRAIRRLRVIMDLDDKFSEPDC